MSDEIWLQATTKVFHDNYSADVISKTLDTESGQVKCVEALKSTLGDGKLVVSCINPNLRLALVFTGNSSVRPVLYAILAKEHKVT